jgi:hypothetical protein
LPQGEVTMLSPLAHHIFSTFAGFLRSRQGVTGLSLIATGIAALLWLRVDTSIAALALLALLAWGYSRSTVLTKSGQLVLLWIAYPVVVFWEV